MCIYIYIYPHDAAVALVDQLPLRGALDALVQLLAITILSLLISIITLI